MNEPPNKIWGNGINLSGLWSTDPMFFTYNDEIGGWWHSDGNTSIEKLGVYVVKSKNVYTFSSTNKREVLIWTKGVIAALDMMKRWASYDA